MKSCFPICLNYLTVLLVFLALFLPIEGLNANQDNVEVSIQSNKKSIENNEIISLLIKVQNSGKTDLNLLAEISSSFPLLSKKLQLIIVSPGSHQFIPVKVISKLDRNTDRTHYVCIEMNSTDSTLLTPITTDTFFFEVKPRKFIQISVPQEEILFTNKNDSTQVPIQVINKGSTQEEIRIIARFPNYINEQDYIQLAKILLPPFSDTVIYHTIKSSKSLMKKSRSRIKITGVYKDGNIFGLAGFTIKTARNNRSYTAEQRAQSPIDVNNQGSINFYSNYLFGANEQYQFLTKNSILLPNENKINYQLDISYWKHGNQNLLIKNSYLNYESRHMNLNIGNMYRNFDLSLSGKGIAVELKDVKKESTLEIGTLKNGYNLLGDGHTTNDQAIWGLFTGSYEDFDFSTFIVNQQVPFNQSNITLIGVNLNFQKKKNPNASQRTGILELKVAAGNTFDQSGLEKAKQGMSMDLNYQKSLGKYSFNSKNSYGSTYYPGQKRGLFSFDERISKSFSKNDHLWIHFSYDNLDPGKLPGSVFLSWKRNTSALQIGYSRKIAKDISVSASGKYYSEENNYASLIGLPSSYSTLTGTFMDLSSTFSNPFSNLYFSMNFGTGIYETPFRQDQFAFHHKGNFNIRYKAFTLITDYRNGFFSVIDLVNSERNQKQNYKSYTISTSMDQDFLKNRLKSNLMLSWNGSNQYGSSMTIRVNLSYQLSKTIKIAGAFSQNRFSQSNYQLNNLSFGYEQQIPVQTLNRNHNRDLSVFVYYDHNQNGQFDAGDKPAVNQLLIINQQLLKTNPKGKVNYKNLPIGSYEIQTRNKNTWIGENKTIDLKRDTTLLIPLIQIGKIAGKLIFSTNKFSALSKINLGGITITALDKNGIEFETITDSKGLFTFFLQENTYIIFIKKEHQNSLTETIAKENIVVDKLKSQLITLEIRAKELDYKTKKFHSQSKNN